MIKLVFDLWRLPHPSLDGLHRDWREGHVALVESERSSIDFGNSPPWFAEEKPVFGD